ncbi:MAG: M61 family metallopeptidase [Burkholderiaceae bacterium]|jgi:predicted metalloprotease with PDZ domain|nr:PDZ domain-containing protein [Aquabacterium sp.]NUP85679.1 M61 family metallopeptidase [Burkholderiaceae bacterium]
MISYRIDIAEPHTHHFEVTVHVPRPVQQQELSLPVWIPGSYMVREFGRHLSGLRAWQGRTEVPLEQLDKTTWRAQCADARALRVTYRVYAFDTSVRTAFLDDRRGFFNGTGLCLRVAGREADPHVIQLGRLPRGWSVATAMPSTGEREYTAADYDELVDHPFELGAFWRGEFEACGVPHEFIVAGAWPGWDGQRLLDDTRRICEQQIRFWHGDAGAPPPFGRYVFMLNAVDEGYGGLEHRASTALIAARRDLPRHGMETLPDGYVTLLGLISHEYFHTWNVKRLKPVELAQPDYTRENYTRLLWFFEGFTSYYDDLMLRRAGLIDVGRYLKLLAKSVNTVAATPGRQVQSVAEASFDAWVKYYRPDENTPNATVSYYVKGSLIALALDLRLRHKGSSLDVLMRRLWALGNGGPISEDDIDRTLRAMGQRAAADDLRAWVHGTDELPLVELFKSAAVQWNTERAGWAASLGLRLSEGAVSGIQVRQVLAGSAASQAGICAGDELLAVDGWRVRRLDDAQAWVPRQQAFDLLLVRDQRVRQLRVQPQTQSALQELVTLASIDKAPAATLARRRAWIAG